MGVNSLWPMVATLYQRIPPQGAFHGSEFPLASGYKYGRGLDDDTYHSFWTHLGEHTEIFLQS